MADAKITALTDIGTVATADVLPIVDDPAGTPVTKKATVAQLRTAMMPVSVATDVTGTLPAANGGFAADISAQSGVPLFATGVATFTGTSGTGDFARVTSPTFVTPVLGAATATSVVASSHFGTSGTLPSAGAFRLANETSIYGRSSGGTNIRGIYFTGTLIYIGGDSGASGVVVDATSSVSLAIGGTTIAQVTTAGLRVNDGGGQYYTFAPSNIVADRTITLPLLTGNDTLVTEAHTQTLTNKTLTSPTINSCATSGTATYTNSRGRVIDYTANHQTTTAATETITGSAFTISDNTTVVYDFIVTMRAVGATAKAASYSGKAAYYRNGAGPQLLGSAEYGTALETTAGDGVAFNVSGNDLRVDVTAADADDRNWFIAVRVQEVSNAA